MVARRADVGDYAGALAGDDVLAKPELGAPKKWRREMRQVIAQ